MPSLASLFSRTHRSRRNSARATAVAADTLAPRVMLSATVQAKLVETASGTRLDVIGTDGDDRVRVLQTGNAGAAGSGIRVEQLFTNATTGRTRVERIGIATAGGTVSTIDPRSISRVFVDGRDGDDTVRVAVGRRHRTAIFGGEGRDILVGGNSFDRIDGGAGNDVLRGGREADVLLGGSGVDRLLGEAGDDRLEGGADRDTLFGGPGFDRLSGGGGNDALYGQGDDDVLYGFTGRDLLKGNAGDDLLIGETGIAARADTVVRDGEDAVVLFAHASATFPDEFDRGDEPTNWSQAELNAITDSLLYLSKRTNGWDAFRPTSYANPGIDTLLLRISDGLPGSDPDGFGTIANNSTYSGLVSFQRSALDTTRDGFDSRTATLAHEFAHNLHGEDYQTPTAADARWLALSGWRLTDARNDEWEPTRASARFVPWDYDYNNRSLAGGLVLADALEEGVYSTESPYEDYAETYAAMAMRSVTVPLDKAAELGELFV